MESEKQVSVHQNPQETTQIRVVPPWRVFNLPLFSNWLVLDARHGSEFANGHIAGAISIPPTDPKGTTADLLKRLLAFLDKFGMPDHLEAIVIYGPDQRVQWLAGVVSKLVHLGDEAVLAKNKNQSGQMEEEKKGCGRASRQLLGIVSFLQRLKRVCKEIWILNGGFEEFQKEYPALCGKETDISHLKPTPHYICPGLYLGSRAVDLGSPDFRQLHVSGAIVTSRYAQPPSDDEKAPKLCQKQRMQFGVEYLVVSTPDKPGAKDWAGVWTAAVHFIEQKKTEGKSVVIQVHGRSLSASVAAAWIHKSDGVSVKEAVRRVLDACPKVDVKLIMIEDLESWSRSLGSSSNSDEVFVHQTNGTWPNKRKLLTLHST